MPFGKNVAEIDGRNYYDGTMYPNYEWRLMLNLVVNAFWLYDPESGTIPSFGDYGRSVAIDMFMTIAFEHMKNLEEGDVDWYLALFAGWEAFQILNDDFWVEDGDERCPPPDYDYCNFYNDFDEGSTMKDMITWNNAAVLGGIANMYEVVPIGAYRDRFDMVMATLNEHNWDDQETGEDGDVDMGYFSIRNKQPPGDPYKQADLSDNMGLAWANLRMYKTRCNLGSPDLCYRDTAEKALQSINKHHFWTDCIWKHTGNFIGRHHIYADGSKAVEICTGCNFALLNALLDMFDSYN